jgi:hypothetical protein
MRGRAECLCYDCRQRGLISASKGPGNALPEAVTKYERGVDLVYFANAFIVDEASRERLEFSKLREDSANTTAMSSCCGTLMCGTHPMYEGHTVSVNADSCRVTTPADVPSMAVVFASDAPEKCVAAIKDLRSVPVIYDVFNSLDHPALQTFVKNATEPVSDRVLARANTNFEQLCASKSLTIDNAFFDESRGSKPN